MNALQPPPQVLHISAPPAPNNPAIDTDLMHADHYVEAMVIARRGGVVSLANVTTSREAASVNNLAGGPPWFQQAIADINQRLDHIDNRLQTVQKIAALSFNTQHQDGRFIDFVEVPFLNGDLPSQAPHFLPELRNFDSITNLSVLESARYWNHYYHGNLPALPDRLIMIRRAIGCTAEI